MKQCTTCKRKLSDSAFYMKGLIRRSTCKTCFDERSKFYIGRYKTKYGFSFSTIYRIGGVKTLLAIINRDGRKCRNCKSNSDLSFDHIDGRGRHYIDRGLLPNNDLGNLRILCRTCHGSVSGKLRHV